MISYSIPKNIRYTAYLGIFFAAVFIHELLIRSLFSGPHGPSPTMQSLSAVTIAGVIFYAFEKVLWKAPGLLGLPIVPNFGGQWYGYIVQRRSFERSKDDPGIFTEKTEGFIPVLVTIDQNFSDINISLRSYNPNFNVSRTGILAEDASECRLASIDTSNPRRPRLRYAFTVKFPFQPDLEGYSEMTMSDTSGVWSLHGTYFSNRRRLAVIELHRARRWRPTLQTCMIRAFPDGTDIKYIGVDIPDDTIDMFSRQFRAVVGSRRFARLRKSRRERDGRDSHHLTIVAPNEYRSISEENPGLLKTIEGFIGQAIWIECQNLGHVKSDSSEVYYVISACPFGEMIRASLGLRRADFHVTIGIDGGDIHDVAKDASTRIRGIPLLSMLPLKDWKIVRETSSVSDAG